MLCLAEADDLLAPALRRLRPPSAQTLGQHNVHAQGAALLARRSFEFRARCRSGKRLTATTAGQTVDICDVGHVAQQIRQSALPARRGSPSSSSVFARPPCIFSARTVATTTTAAGRQARHAALDVEELLRAEVGAEARLGDGVVAPVFSAMRVASTRVAAVGDVGERAAVDEAPGVPSSVCTRLGLSASLRSAAIAPAALRSPRGDRAGRHRYSRRRCAQGAPSGRQW